MNTQSTILSRRRRAHRTRFRMRDSAARPRLSVFRSLKHISVQIIDDTNNRTLAAADDRSLTGTKTERAVQVGQAIAVAAQAAGVTQVVFDRGPYLYHGRVKALAEAARAGGLQF